MPPPVLDPPDEPLVPVDDSSPELEDIGPLSVVDVAVKSVVPEPVVPESVPPVVPESVPPVVPESVDPALIIPPLELESPELDPAVPELDVEPESDPVEAAVAEPEPLVVAPSPEVPRVVESPPSDEVPVVEVPDCVADEVCGVPELGPAVPLEPLEPVSVNPGKKPGVSSAQATSHNIQVAATNLPRPIWVQW